MRKQRLILFLIVISLTFSCKSLKMAAYDQYSYQKAVEIKIDASKLIDKSTGSYRYHLKEIQQLESEIDKIVEYEKYKPNNEITYKMWKILSNKEKNLLSGFLKRWKEKEQLSSFFVKEAKAQIMEAMTLLIQFEGTKEPEVKDKLLKLIANN